MHEDTINLIEQGLRGKAIENLVDGWAFRVEEVSSNVFLIHGTNMQGKSVSAYGIDPERVLAVCVKRAKRIFSIQQFLQKTIGRFQKHKLPEFPLLKSKNRFFSFFMNLLTLSYHSTHYYALEIKGGKLLVDCGWPGSLPEFSAVAKRMGMELSEIKYILATHYHPDHAGLAQELKNLGAKLVVMQSQVNFVSSMADQIKKDVPYTPIRLEDNLLLKFSESRKFLAGLGIDGEIISTPGHSDDHVTLILDDGSAFTGDLPPRFVLTDEQTQLKTSWERIYQHKVTRLYPAHGD
jgi:endoribonuclease LACTB2